MCYMLHENDLTDRGISNVNYKSLFKFLCFSSLSLNHCGAFSIFQGAASPWKFGNTKSWVHTWMVCLSWLWPALRCVFHPSVIPLWPDAKLHPPCITDQKPHLSHTHWHDLYSIRQKCRCIISPVVNALIYIRNNHLVWNPPKCRNSNDAFSWCGDVVMGFRVVYMPSLGRAFLN